MNLKLHAIPLALRQLPAWILWRNVPDGDKMKKLPFCVNGGCAKSDTPETWGTFEAAAALAPKFSGIGFVFSADDPFCGIDLDGCRDPETGRVAEWARKIILDLNSYAEVSPSQTGVKIWVIGKSPLDRGRNRPLKNVEKIGDKEPAIEVYDKLRYFAMTGWALKGMGGEPQERQRQLDVLCDRYFVEKTQDDPAWQSDAAIVERARKYIAKLPPAVSGSSGHNATFHAACVLVLGFGLSEGDALGLMREYNQSCRPPWSERELVHKVNQAAKQGGARNYLRNEAPKQWASLRVPQYILQEAPTAEPRLTTLAAAAKSYLDSIRGGVSPLIGVGIDELDYALGGGVEKGELIIFGARPSHGKSAVALQCVHHWTAQGMPCAIVSEEMSALALGKRTVQFVSSAPQEHWPGLAGQLDLEIDAYASGRAPCVVLEGCGSAKTVIAEVEKCVSQEKIQALVVDYAQLLRGAGRTRYEQMTDVSIVLRGLTSAHKLVLLVLCQLNREIDKRSGEFKPALSDLKETGQFEQDADVVCFLCWPWRLNPDKAQSEYQFFIEKNRNRGIMQRIVDCSFDPSRQKISLPLPNYVNTPFDNVVGRDL